MFISRVRILYSAVSLKLDTVKVKEGAFGLLWVHGQLSLQG